MDILRLLVRNGCRNAESKLDKDKNGFVRFQVSEHKVHISLPLPSESPFGTGGERTRKWQGLHSLLKAKLEAVDSGISTMEQEFQAYMGMEVTR